MGNFVSNFGTGENWKGNRKGRPPRPEIELFREALELVQTEKKTTLLEHAVRKAFESENVLIALLKKILPDKMDVAMKAEILPEEMLFIKNSIKEFELAKHN